MVFSATTTYAIRILVYMAGHESEHVTGNSLFKALSIKQQYMRRVLTSLVKDGFIASARGRNGGFVFARPASGIYISEVINAIEGHNPVEKCILGVSDCKRVPVCAMHAFWTQTRENLIKLFSTTSLSDLKESPGDLVMQ